MVGTTLKIRVDEDAVETNNQIQTKKVVASTNEIQTKRAVLGAIQNRGVQRALQNSKDVAQKDMNDAKLQNALRNAKARVDTHWKKLPLGNAGNNVTAAIKVPTNAAATVDNADGQRRILLRSNSIRVGSNSTTTANGAQRQALVNGLQTTKLTTANVKVAESKLATDVNEKSKSKKSTEGKTEQLLVEAVGLRGQDSNLPRKSLTRFRAALTRDGASKPSAAAKSNSAAITVPAAKKEVLKTGPVPKPTALVEPSACRSGGVYRRLEGIDDIDADDKSNLLLVSQYVNEIYDYLYTVEDKLFIKKDHLEGQVEVHSKMRAVLIDWINEVHMQFHLAPESFHMSVAIIDLYLQIVKDTKRLHLQLVGVTALFIATKYEELFPPAIGDFVYITDDTYTAKQIRAMEYQMLRALNFDLSRPLSIQFLRRYSKAAGAEDAHHAMSKYFLELASIEYDLASCKPSEIAAASLFLSLHLLNSNAKVGTGLNNKHWTKTLEFYSRYTAEPLRPITKRIAAIARAASQAKLKAIYSKYQSTKFQKIALRPELYGALMDSIINSK